MPVQLNFKGKTGCAIKWLTANTWEMYVYACTVSALSQDIITEWKVANIYLDIQFLVWINILPELDGTEI